MKLKKGLYLMCTVAIMSVIFFKSPIKVASDTSDEYHIKVNRQTNTITVYRKEGRSYEPIKAMFCSTGGRMTPLGTFKTSRKYRWRNLYYGFYGQYSTRITGPILFHSIPYRKKNVATMQKGEYEKLGKDASHGCIRLATKDAKWIYDNCPPGTKVTIYTSKNKGPLNIPKPVPCKKEGYDPTDIWALGKGKADKKPILTVPSKIKLSIEDEEYDLLEGVKAVDAYGNDITDDVEVDDNVDFETPGKYVIKYIVSDEFGNKVSAKSNVIIE